MFDSSKVFRFLPIHLYRHWLSLRISCQHGLWVRLSNLQIIDAQLGLS